MEAERRILLLTISLVFVVLLLQSLQTRASHTTSFIAASCKGTTYPHLCFDSLSPYESAVGSNHWKLCNRAMWVTLQAARNSSVLVYGLSKKHGLSNVEAEVIDVCVENVIDGSDRIRQSMDAMGVGQLTKSNFDWQISNIKTWMSAAITDMMTCEDAFDELKLVNPKLKNKVVRSVHIAEKFTSNALYLINNLRF